MPLSGYTATLPDEVALNPAIVKVGANIWGVTRGGVSWDPEETWGGITFDGMRAPVKGTIRKDKFGGKLAFTIIQFGKTAAVQLKQLSAGATVVSQVTAGEPTDIVTPLGAGVFVPDTGYLDDVRAYWQLGDGAKYFAIYLPSCYCSKAPIKGADSGEAEAAVELVPCLDLTTQAIGDAPYKYELWSEVPTA